jgi:hypothetical protein
MGIVAHISGRDMRETAQSLAKKRAATYESAYWTVCKKIAEFKCMSVTRLLGRSVSTPNYSDYKADVAMILRDEKDKIAKDFAECVQNFVDGLEPDAIDKKKFRGTANVLGKKFLNKMTDSRGKSVHTYFQRSGTQARRDKEAAEYRDMIQNVRALEEERTNAA